METTRSGKTAAELSPEELKILELMRDLPYGELVVTVKNGAPVRAEIRRSILLNGGENGKLNRL